MSGNLSVCKECHKPIDMGKVGSIQVSAHGRKFCSVKCVDAWESNPENTDALRQSHEKAKDMWLPYDEKIIRARWGAMTIDDEPSITIPDEAWQTFPSDVDDGRSRLLTTIWVNGTPMHLEAHAVRTDDNDCQADDGEDSMYDSLNSAFEVENAQQTTTIAGREYVLFAHAFGD